MLDMMMSPHQLKILASTIPVTRLITCRTVLLIVEGSNHLIVNSLQPGNANQHWRYNKQRRTFDNDANSNKVLDVSGGSKEQGAAVCAWDCHGKENQRWKIEPRSARTPR